MATYRDGRVIGGSLSTALTAVTFILLVWSSDTWLAAVGICMAMLAGAGACHALGAELAKPCAPSKTAEPATSLLNEKGRKL